MTLDSRIQPSRNDLGFWKINEEGKVGYRVWAIKGWFTYTLYCMDCWKCPFLGEVYKKFDSANTQEAALEKMKHHIQFNLIAQAR